MTDYRPLLSRAIANLDPNTGEARRAVYDRARTALVNQLRGMNPPLAEADITRQRLALEEAIRKIEGEAASAQAAPPPPQQPAAPPSFDDRAPRAPMPPRADAPSRGAPPPRDAYDNGNREAPRPPRERDPFADAPQAGRGAPPPRGPREDEYPRERDPRDTRDPRDQLGFNGRCAGPRGQRPQNDQGSLRPRHGRGKSPADYAREDARRAGRTKLVVGTIFCILLILAGTLGYLHRDKVFRLLGRAKTAVTQTQTDPNQNKPADRIQQNEQTQQNQQSPQPLPPSTQQTAGAIRAILFEESPGGQQFVNFNGTATWRIETINPGPGRPADIGARVDVSIPERKMTAVITIRRNPDPALPASHYVEVQFNAPDDANGGIAQVPVVRMKNNESAQGIPLAGLSVRVMQGYYLIGLSSVETDRDRNLVLLGSQPWFDVPFVYGNGRRAVLAFEKGAAGVKAMDEVFAAWGYVKQQAPPHIQQQ